MEVRGETFHLSAVCAGQRQLSAFGCCTPELEPSPHPAEMTGKIKKNFWPCCERGRYGRDSTEQLGILKATQMAECIILPKICRIFHRLLWKYSVKINNPVSFYFPKESSRNSAAVSWRKQTNKQPKKTKPKNNTQQNPQKPNNWEALQCLFFIRDWYDEQTYSTLIHSCHFDKDQRYLLAVRSPLLA